ncbi:MAG TPA: hypothetical protein VMT76_00920 [Puia sp.]|nr:hypothetical protein [Puia sp.]
MNKSFFLIIMIAILAPFISLSQFYVEPFAGYQKDMNNYKSSFFNSGVQAVFKMRKYELLLQLQKNFPGSWNAVDSAFTLNTSLPLYAPAQKNISISFFSVAFGNRFRIVGKDTGACLVVKLYTGLMFQKISVKYEYDKNDYTVLNPDQSQNADGIFVSAGLEYMWQFKKSRFFADLNFSTPPWENLRYPSSYNLMAPLSFNIGYSFMISKK